MPAGPPRATIQVDGLRELQRALRRSVDSDLPKRLGQANKRIGELIISRLKPNPLAVGVGKGATVRPSASKREVLLRVGGTHRPKPPMSVWGAKRVGALGVPVPRRPFIKGTAENHIDELADAYLSELMQAMDPSFAETENL